MGKIVGNTYKYTSLSCDQWKQVLLEMKKDDLILQIIKVLYSLDNYRLNASVIAELLGYGHHLQLNNAVGTFGHLICDKYQLKDYPLRDDGKGRWWNIIFDGEDVYENGKSVCNWIIKPEMLNAINQLGLLKKRGCNLNSINKDLHEQIKTYKGISSFEGKERKSIIKIRCNQGRVRNYALQKYEKCEVCGLQITSLLIASHIKPWSDSTPLEKADIDNIMLLCPTHDALFDKHLISFDNNGGILINPNITEEEVELLNINKNQKIAVNEKRRAYLEIHRKQFNKMA